MFLIIEESNYRTHIKTMGLQLLCFLKAPPHRHILYPTPGLRSLPQRVLRRLRSGAASFPVPVSSRLHKVIQ